MNNIYRKMYVGNALAVAVSLPMVANATNETPSASTAITAQAAQADGVQILRINPTTVELCFANHRRVAVDFYGENIFRIFEDHNGGVMRDPEAKPEAHILVDNPRTKVGSLQITEQGDEITLASSKAKVIFNKTTGLAGIDISHIAWSQQAKRLVVAYGDGNIDLVSASGDITNVPGLYPKP